MNQDRAALQIWTRRCFLGGSADRSESRPNVDARGISRDRISEAKRVTSDSRSADRCSGRTPPIASDDRQRGRSSACQKMRKYARLVGSLAALRAGARRLTRRTNSDTRIADRALTEWPHLHAQEVRISGGGSSRSHNRLRAMMRPRRRPGGQPVHDLPALWP